MLKFKDLKLKIVEKFKYFAPVSLAIILIGIILMIVPGMNVGIDFAGGGKLEVEFGSYLYNNESIRDDLVQKVEETVKGKGFEIGSTRWSGDDKTQLEIGLKYSLNGKKVDANNTDAQQEFVDLLEDTEDGSLKATVLSVVNEAYPDLQITIDDIRDTVVSGATSQNFYQTLLVF